MRIGIDLDNTIIHYDDAFVKAARERELVAHDFTGTKQQVRDHIRTLENGEVQWQMLQGYVYGKGIEAAKMFPGFPDFMRRCRRDPRISIFIVSHKTEFGHYDPERINLRDAARHWLQERKFFDEDGFAIPKDHLHFKATRTEKILKIIQLKCDLFIDDLVEVFDDPRFPSDIRQILFHSNEEETPEGEWTLCRNWKAIEEAVFSHAG